MAPLYRALRWLLGAALAFGLVTWVALEGHDVTVLRTHPGDNSWRSTHVWTVDGDEGSLWVEAATPERSWFLDVQRDARVETDREGATKAWHAVPVEDDETRDRIRGMMREKYGWADRWVGLLQDTSESIVVRLDPAS